MSDTPSSETTANPDINPLRNGCDDIWTWDRRERSPEVRLHGPNFRIAHFHPNWSSGTAGVRGTRVLNNGRYFWELHLSRRIFGTSMMFGIGNLTIGSKFKWIFSFSVYHKFTSTYLILSLSG